MSLFTKAAVVDIAKSEIVEVQMSVIQKFVQSQLCNLPEASGVIKLHDYPYNPGYVTHQLAYDEQQMEEFAIQMIEKFFMVQQEAQKNS